VSGPGSTVYLSALNAMGTALATARGLRALGREVTMVVPRRLRGYVEGAGLGFPIGDTGPDMPSVDKLHDELAFHLSSLTPGANPDNAVLHLGGGQQRHSRRTELRSAIRRSWKLHLAKLPNPQVNALLRATVGRWVPNVFPSRHVVAISFAARPALLCAPGLYVDTVLDSWDHPVRKCAGYVTRTVVAWNRELAWEWKDFQGAERIEVGYPVRLGYALRQNVGPSERAERVMMYPIATTSHIQRWFMDEMAFLLALADRAAARGWTVLAKPKPISTRDEIPAAVRNHASIRLGGFEASSGALDYALDDAVNSRRLDELREARFVLNTVTTFGLDAAAAGVPVLQLDLRSSRAWPSLASAARNRHLQRYLYRGRGCLDPGDALERLDELLADPSTLLEQARSTSELLRRWLTEDLVDLSESEVMARAARGLVGAQ
jgi:hypothetical protein